MIKIYTTICILILFGCSSNQTGISKDAGNTTPFAVKPLIIKGAEEGWGANMRISFTERTVTEKAIVYKLNATYNNKNIGFKMSVPQEGLVNLTFESAGESSDNFLLLLQKLYKQKIDTSSAFVDSLHVDCMKLALLNPENDKDVVLAAERKLFFQSAEGDDYAELFLNINETGHWIELEEKDEAYRPMIIKFFTKK